MYALSLTFAITIQPAKTHYLNVSLPQLLKWLSQERLLNHNQYCRIYDHRTLTSLTQWWSFSRQSRPAKVRRGPVIFKCSGILPQPTNVLSCIKILHRSHSHIRAIMLFQSLSQSVTLSLRLLPLLLIRFLAATPRVPELSYQLQTVYL